MTGGGRCTLRGRVARAGIRAVCRGMQRTWCDSLGCCGLRGRHDGHRERLVALAARVRLRRHRRAARAGVVPIRRAKYRVDYDVVIENYQILHSTFLAALVRVQQVRRSLVGAHGRRLAEALDHLRPRHAGVDGACSAGASGAAGRGLSSGRCSHEREREKPAMHEYLGVRRRLWRAATRKCGGHPPIR